MWVLSIQYHQCWSGHKQFIDHRFLIDNLSNWLNNGLFKTTTIQTLVLFFLTCVLIIFPILVYCLSILKSADLQSIKNGIICSEKEFSTFSVFRDYSFLEALVLYFCTLHKGAKGGFINSIDWSLRILLFRYNLWNRNIMGTEEIFSE